MVKNKIKEGDKNEQFALITYDMTASWIWYTFVRIKKNFFFARALCNTLKTQLSLHYIFTTTYHHYFYRFIPIVTNLTFIFINRNDTTEDTAGSNYHTFAFFSESNLLKKELDSPWNSWHSRTKPITTYQFQSSHHTFSHVSEYIPTIDTHSFHTRIKPATSYPKYLKLLHISL